MRSGKLNRIVTIQKATPSRNEVGEDVMTYNVLCQRRAYVKEKQGAEQVIGENMVSVQRYDCSMRYDSVLCKMDTTWRILIDCKVYGIDSIDNVEGMNREIRMRITEVD